MHFDKGTQTSVPCEGDLLWIPSTERKISAPITAYQAWLEQRLGRHFADYGELWQWSVSELEAFWASIWDYFQIQSDEPYKHVVDSHRMPGATWFEGSRVNYAEHILRHEGVQPDKPALRYLAEMRAPGVMTWRELGSQVRRLATSLRELGLRPGDRIVSYMPNIPETAIAMLATTAIGAIWSSAAPEFGVATVLDRFAQIEPKLIFMADGYVYGGKTFSRVENACQIAAHLPSLEHVVWLPLVDPCEDIPLADAHAWQDLLAGRSFPAADFRYERVAHDHPLWILFSSGTTGLPKAIVHSHVGVLMELLKFTALHLGLHHDSVMFFYSTTGWMMWNVVIATLLAGGTAVLYDGNPAFPSVDLIWKVVQETGATCVGASPTFVQLMQKNQLSPKTCFNLERLESFILTGSPATPQIYAWLLNEVKADAWINVVSGGTELCSALVGGVATLPVRAGEIQARMLGIHVRCWNDEGHDLVDEVGELVVTSPFPSMPLFFWNDPDGKRYHEAYFDTYPDVWRHGDFIKINRHGGCYIYGRSDATLNRYGVRIGTAEIYRTVEQLDAIADSLIVGCELPSGGFFMPLFLKLKPGFVLDQDLCDLVVARLKQQGSPRHVPDRVYAVDAIPYTLTGKKMEVPVRKILMGWPVEKVASRDAMRDPAAIEYFVRFAQESTDYQWQKTSSSTPRGS